MEAKRSESLSKKAETPDLNCFFDKNDLQALLSELQSFPLLQKLVEAGGIHLHIHSIVNNTVIDNNLNGNNNGIIVGESNDGTITNNHFKKNAQSNDNMEISTFELKKILTEAVQAGIQSYIEMSRKNEKMLTKRKAYQFLADIGERPTLLDTMIKDGLLKGERRGTRRNSPITYKKSELLTAMGALKIINFMNP